jgi:radical SAM protein with 4Fe4S-binding SPASM domain
MKIRQGFVSNSSSSSFVCDVCQVNYSGWDASPSDFDHKKCIRGHIFCSDLLVDKEKFQELCDKFDEVEYESLPDEWYNEEDSIEKYGLSDDDRYEVPQQFCPICSMTQICNSDCISYMYKKYNTNNEELAKEIRDKFSNYDEFCNYLKGK